MTREPRILWGKDSVFNKWYWENWIFTCRIMDPYVTSLTKINSKLIKDLDIRPEPIKLPEKNIREKFLNDFWQ